MFGKPKGKDKARYSLNAKELVSDISKVDEHPYLILWVYDLAVDGTGEHSAQLMNELPRRGWKFIDWRMATAGNGIGTAIHIYTLYRRERKANE